MNNSCLAGEAQKNPWPPKGQGNISKLCRICIPSDWRFVASLRRKPPEDF
jgi:hypothetical protein